jgi:hypothetical protein
MKKKTKRGVTLEKKVRLLRLRASHRILSIRDILEVLSGSGKAVLLIVLSLPFCQPLQIPGFSTPFGIAIAFCGVRMAFGKRIWLPKRILEKRIHRHTLKKITGKILRILKKIKPWIHSRLSGLCDYPGHQLINGLIIAVSGTLLALPLPIPLSNLAAAWSIFLIALGIIEEDGVCVLIGYTAFLLTAAFFLLMLLPLLNRFLIEK